MTPAYLVALGALISGLVAGGAQKPKLDLRPVQGALKVGAPAPRFQLSDPDGKNDVRLADLKGKPVVLVFGSCT